MKVDRTRLHFYGGLVVGLVDTITGIDPVGNSSRSERTRGIGMPCAYLLVFRTAGEDDGTDATTQKYVL